ncbi:coatomer epsilon subunit-domain-containing protein [Suillus fuscotomentosus]|uniref:Coatomer epsilon subunit-domain-containing protein n=1 Tax=Suillus fuscotomentosus TaxID=1912939 RepID=A0AAD4EKL7_9AGAM|nr:coatomer epsilon subunit-domain-containing protein [Suillus fuscotomentosus]KAG1907850.1 coatomer epsilon subunit-domain-containing protein [Suillus fuscotomentosus]
MDVDLYFIKQQFTLGAYPALLSLQLPDPSSSDYSPYSPLQENVALKAAAALAKGEQGLETLRDLCVEIEADQDSSDWEKQTVQVLAATAFVRAGEIEEALETLRTEGIPGDEEAALLTQVYLSLARPALAQKVLAPALKANPDALVLQLAEAAISLVTGSQGTSGEPYAPALSFYNEQVANPSISSPALLVGRAVVRILRGELSSAQSDLEEAESILSRAKCDQASSDMLAAMIVATGLSDAKKGEADQLWSRFLKQHPSHPLVADIAAKDLLFDQCASKIQVPPRACRCRLESIGISPSCVARSLLPV